jgi:hypothetical protein
LTLLCEECVDNKDLKLADATGAQARNRSRAPRGTNNSTKGEKIFNALRRYSAV